MMKLHRRRDGEIRSSGARSMLWKGHCGRPALLSLVLVVVCPKHRPLPATTTIYRVRHAVSVRPTSKLLYLSLLSSL